MGNGFRNMDGRSQMIDRGCLAMLRFTYGTLLGLLAIVFIAPSVRAELQVDVEVLPTKGSVRDEFSIEVRIQGVDGSIQPPRFRDSAEFEISPAGTATQLQFLNGVQSFQLSFHFSLVPRPDLKPGTYPIPQGFLSFGGQEYALQRPTLTIEQLSRAAAESSSDGLAFTHIVDDLKPFIGQQVLYRAEIATRETIQDAELQDIDFNGFWHESFGQPRETVRNRGRHTLHLFSVREALFPTESGTLHIPKRTLTARVLTKKARRYNLSDPLQHLFDFNYGPYAFDSKRVRVVADAIDLDVRPLPAPPVTTEEYIPVGSVSIRSELDHSTLTLGDSLSLEIVVTGDANLRPLSLPEPTGSDSKDFKYYPEKPQLETSLRGDSFISEKTFKVALVPQRSGELQLPVYSVLVFNPETKSYEWKRSLSRLLYVEQGSAPLVQTFQSPAIVDTQSSPIPASNETPSLNDNSKLRPLHPVSEIASGVSGIPTYRIWLVLIGVPLIAIFIRISRERLEALRRDPARFRAQIAKQEAFQALDKISTSSGTFDEAARIFRKYVATRWRTPGRELTETEILELLRSDCSVMVENAASVAKKLTTARFAHSSVESDGLAQIIQDIRELITGIDENTQELQK